MSSRYRVVDYHDPTHRYFVGDVTYTSATQLIDKYKQKFDPLQESIRMAETYGHDPEYWRRKWTFKSQRALHRGTKIHQEHEVHMLQQLEGRGHLQTLAGWTSQPELNYRRDLPDGTYPELKLWHHEFRVAGRTDKATIRTIDHQGSKWKSYEEMTYEMIAGMISEMLGNPAKLMDIDDYKTNELIRRESFRDSSGKYRMMKEPLNHLMDCEYSHYSLQLSLYQYMAEYLGFLPGKRRIIFEQNPSVYEGLLEDLPGEFEPEILELPYLRQEVENMLHHAMEN